MIVPIEIEYLGKQGCEKAIHTNSSFTKGIKFFLLDSLFSDVSASISIPIVRISGKAFVI